jgi:hypothetical protein
VGCCATGAGKLALVIGALSLLLLLLLLLLTEDDEDEQGGAGVVAAAAAGVAVVPAGFCELLAVGLVVALPILAECNVEERSTRWRASNAVVAGWLVVDWLVAFVDSVATCFLVASAIMLAMISAGESFFLVRLVRDVACACRVVGVAEAVVALEELA